MMPEPDDDPIARALLAQLADDPDDLARLGVLADHLQSRGDARGELLALSLAVAAGNHDAALAQRRGELMHALAPPLEAGDRVTWGVGFIRTLALQRTRKALAADEALWRHPSLALLSELEVELKVWGNASYMPRLIELLPRSLRSLVHTSQTGGELWPDLGALAALPRLDELAFVGHAAFAQLAHPRLRRLDVALKMPFAHLSTLARAKLPALVELAFRGTAEARDFDYLIDVLAATGWLARVTHLALVSGDLTALGIGQLEAALAGRRLAELDLTGTRVRADVRPQLAALCEQLVVTSLIAETVEPYVEHTGKPEWGRGYVIRRFEGKLEIEFAAVGRRVFVANAPYLRFVG